MFRERITDSLSRYRMGLGGAGRAWLGLLVALPVLLFAGCGSDDDDGVTAPILGPDSGQIRTEVTVNGQPLSGVTATLAGPTGFSPQTATTDANGVALFTNLPNGNYTVTLSGFNPGQVTFSQTTVPATISDEVGLVTLQFQGTGPATGAVSGIVTVNGQTPAQLSGQSVTVTLTPSGGTPVNGNLTGSTGEFSFTGLGAGTYTLGVTVNGDLRTTTFTLAQGQQLALNVDFAALPVVTPITPGTPTGQVRAVVTTDGQPLSGVTVTLGGPVQRTATTGSDGIATFDQLANGTYTVQISGFDTSRFLFTQTSTQVTLDQNIGLVTAQFQGTGTPTGVIGGRVTVGGVTPADIPNQSVSITLVPSTGNPVTGDLTRTTGQFSFTQLPAGTHTLRVAVDGQTRTTAIALAQGEQRTVNVEFNSLTP